MFRPSSIVFSYSYYLLLYLLYLVIQHFCCQSDNKIQFSSVQVGRTQMMTTSLRRARPAHLQQIYRSHSMQTLVNSHA